MGKNFRGGRARTSGFQKRKKFSGNRGGRGPSKLNITSFIEKAKLAPAPAAIDLTVNRTFTDFALQKTIFSNIEAMGFEKPTPIQDRVFDSVRSGKNVLGIANTGTGKTGAFLIPLIDKLLQDESFHLLVVAPTRELADQINETFLQLVKGTKRYSTLCIGGTNINKQIRQLQRKHHAVIGTPGRIIDLYERKALDLSQFKVVVLDEVDRMLDMGFVNDMRKILSYTPQDRQGLYFSATITDRVSKLIKDFSSDVVEVSVKTSSTTHMVEQEIIRYQHDERKLDVLHDVLIDESIEKVLIFGRTKHGVKKLMFQLRDRGFRTESIHGNKTQSQRQRALDDFKASYVDILVATDVAARGIDVEDVSHVINYEIPDTYDDYVHRIGRTGRGGKRGIAYTFVK